MIKVYQSYLNALQLISYRVAYIEDRHLSSVNAQRLWTVIYKISDVTTVVLRTSVTQIVVSVGHLDALAVCS